jgi:BirA family biotin operon repressor/biotin-[acetyl-CoA-carboxylase] ligase
VWFSPPGAGLYASAVFRPRAEAAIPLFTLMAGAALAGALRESTGLPVHIKWPNDLVVGGRKLGGILAEGSARQGALQHVIVGVGINLRRTTYPPDIADRATSVESELGRSVDRGQVLVAALAALATAYDDLRAGRFEAVLSRWRALAPGSAGARVEWSGPEGVRRGTTAGVDDDGALLVRTGDSVERIIAGEVTWL